MLHTYKNILIAIVRKGRETARQFLLMDHSRKSVASENCKGEKETFTVSQ